ncbi:MAG: hypothetical protein JEZ09_12175 [Salinivirgaceae bacterium]|nr:hypothetical protein [Salinivirgaceae bacterium]
MIRKVIIIWFFIVFGGTLFSQSLSNMRSKIIIINDSIRIDTLSVVPGSEILKIDTQIFSHKNYQFDYAKSLLIITDSSLFNKELQINYRVFPIDFSKANPPESMKIKVDSLNNQWMHAILPGYTATANDKQENRLQINGNISRGIGVGNNQNLVVNSDMNLQMTGFISENIQIEALLSDNSIPIQPDGYSQQIHEFDKVYIKIFDSQRYLQMGDIELKSDDSYFLKFNRKIQGGEFGASNIELCEKTILKTKVSAAIAKGNYNRYEFNGIEGVQGPYKLIGANNEKYIVILAGTEKIYLNGNLLERGENADYVMNYNTAELSFSAKQIITKDSRIITEFEYSDQNYNRFLLYTSNEFQHKNSTYSIQYFSEGDSQNQPINLDLTDNNKRVLQNAGDDPLQAIVPNIDSLAFEANLIRYKMMDTVVNNILYDSVLVQSYNKDSAFYSAGFAFVGENKGNYIQLTSAANGKVFKWIAPQTNIPQGSFEAIQVLIAPKKQQVLVVKAAYKLPKNVFYSIEIALSNKDLNTFSAKDAYDDKGFAIRNHIEKPFQLKQRTVQTNFSYELTSKYFNPVERFRSAEFKRDWNLTVPVFDDEHFVQASVGLMNKKRRNISLTTELLNYRSDYSGFRSELTTNIMLSKFNLLSSLSLLNSKSSLQNTMFYRHKISVARNIWKLNAGISHDFENNILANINTDSLLTTSKKYQVAEAFLQTADSLKRTFGISYKYRQDFLPFDNYLKLANESRDIEFKSKLAKSSFTNLNGSIIYRKLDLIDETLVPSLKADKNLLGRLEHQLRINKRLLSFSTFYETGTGMETKKEFSYLEVATGQGTYEWNDYNGNDVPELDEFDVSLNPESANYIKIYMPSDEYIKVYTLKFNESIKFDPLTLWRDKKGLRKFASRFSNIFSYQLIQKHTQSEIEKRINPFNEQIADSSLLNISESLRNTLSFNRTNTVFGLDYSYSQSHQKSLLSNGFDENWSTANQLKLRWNVTSDITLLNTLSEKSRKYTSDFFSDKKYKIASHENNSNLQWQPSTKLRVGINYTIKKKENLWGDESVFFQEAGPELKINSPKQGMINFKASIILNDYTGATNSSLSYLMLEGFQPGENYKWSVNVSRNLNQFLRLTINYIGRKPASAKIIHTGQFSLSAYF